MKLFDASSIINLAKKGKLMPFLNSATLDLAIYETLNVIWKHAYLLKKINEEAAIEFTDIVCGAINTMDVYSIRGNEREVIKFAIENGITIYDAAYLYTAYKNEMVLVTDDLKLKKFAENYVRTLNSHEIQ